MRPATDAPPGDSFSFDGGCRRENAIDGGGDHDLIAITVSSQDELPIPYIDVGLIFWTDVKGLYSPESKGTHGESAVWTWVCPRT